MATVERPQRPLSLTNDDIPSLNKRAKSAVVRSSIIRRPSRKSGLFEQSVEDKHSKILEKVEQNQVARKSMIDELKQFQMDFDRDRQENSRIPALTPTLGQSKSCATVFGSNTGSKASDHIPASLKLMGIRDPKSLLHRHSDTKQKLDTFSEDETHHKLLRAHSMLEIRSKRADSLKSTFGSKYGHLRSLSSTKKEDDLIEVKEMEFTAVTAVDDEIEVNEMEFTPLQFRGVTAVDEEREMDSIDSIDSMDCTKADNFDIDPFDIDSDIPSKIMDQIYLGNAHHTWNVPLLNKLKITHIVCCISGATNPDSKWKGKRLQIPMDDRGKSSLKRISEKAFPFITDAIESAESHNVLIHCKSSVNRSPTLTVAFLMFHRGLTLKEAHAAVKEKHERICCHDSYMEQLRKYDKELHGQYSTKSDELETTKSMMAKLRQQFLSTNNGST